jgi:hypothetical protein
MSETTVTLQGLRRSICRELRMPFFRKMGNFAEVDTGSTTTKIIDAKLLQRNEYWKNHWFYLVSTQETSLIESFNRPETALLLERALAGAPASGTDYEIHSIWSADEIHAAINRAIKSSRQAFFNSVVDDTTLCLVEDVLEYYIGGLTVVPWIVNKVYIEYPSNAQRGLAVAAGVASITLPSDIDLTDATTTYRITIYGGKGAGQVRQYSTRTGQVVSITQSWTTVPDTTSKFAIFDPTKSGWYPAHNIHFDAPEYPDDLRFTNRNPSFYGGRIRIEYVGVSSLLTAETDTTIVPEEYLINKVCSILHGQVLNGTKADKESHYAEFKRYQDEADSYMVRNAPHQPATHIRNPDAHIDFFYRDTADPLAWRD